MTLKSKDKIFWPKPGDVIQVESRDDIVDAVSAFDPALWSDSVLESYKKVTLIKAVEESMKEDLDKLAVLVDELQDAQEITGKALAEQIEKVELLEEELELMKAREAEVEQFQETTLTMLRTQQVDQHALASNQIIQQQLGTQHTHSATTQGLGSRLSGIFGDGSK